MATLIHKITGQIMADISNVETFLSAVTDPEQWESDAPAADPGPAVADALVAPETIAEPVAASAAALPVDGPVESQPDAPSASVVEAEQTPEQTPVPQVESASEPTAEPVESELAHLLHEAEAGIENLIHKIEGE